MSRSPIAASDFGRASAPPAPPSKFDALAARVTEFWWVEIPGRLRGFSTLLWAAWSDGTYLTAWPRLAATLPVTVFLVGLLEGASHWTFVQWDSYSAHWSMTYVGHGSYAWVFAQILPVLVLAVILGCLSANLGLVLATGYAIGDFLFFDEPWVRHDVIPRFFHFHVPQLICYLLFLLLAVWPTVATKFLVAGAHRRLREEANGLYAAVTAVVLALFVYDWTYMAPMVFRVAWVWEGGIPSPFSVVLFQSFAVPWLVTSAVLGVLLRYWLSRRAESADAGGLALRSRALLAQAAAVPRRGRPWLRALLGAAYLTLLISGFLNSVVAGALIFAVIASAQLARTYLLPRTRLWNEWCTLVSTLPALFRVAAVAVGSYFITLSILAIPGLGAAQNPQAGQFGAEILAWLISVLIMLLVLPNGVLVRDESAASPHGLRAPVPGIATQIGLIAAVVLLSSKRALAQGVCADPGCCFMGSNNVAAGATAGGLPGATAGDPGSGPVDPDPWWKKWIKGHIPKKIHGPGGFYGRTDKPGGGWGGEIPLGDHVTVGGGVEVTTHPGSDPTAPIVDVNVSAHVQVHPATEGPAVDVGVNRTVGVGINTNQTGLDGLSTSTHSQGAGIDDSDSTGRKE